MCATRTRCLWNVIRWLVASHGYLEVAARCVRCGGELERVLERHRKGGPVPVVGRDGEARRRHGRRDARGDALSLLWPVSVLTSLLFLLVPLAWPPLPALSFLSYVHSASSFPRFSSKTPPIFPCSIFYTDSISVSVATRDSSLLYLCPRRFAFCHLFARILYTRSGFFLVSLCATGSSAVDTSKYTRAFACR